MFWISLLAAIGLAIILVEKGEDWPVLIFIPRVKDFLRSIHEKLPEMLNCSVCTVFWTSLLTDAFIFIFIGSYFMWPLTGFAASGLVWVTYQILNTLDNILNAIKADKAEEVAGDVQEMATKSE